MDYIQHLRSMVGKEKVIMVVAGVLVFDPQNRLLFHLRSDNQTWGLPGGFMEFDETIQDTARREVLEETGLRLGKMELFGIYSGPTLDKTLPNGDQVSLVKITFRCHDYKGTLVTENEESLDTRFFPLDHLPIDMFPDHKIIINDLLSGKEQPIFG